MIISASYKTDIPMFYGQWFMNRLRAGYCKMINPYNRRAIRVSLARHDVDGFVFWTKNIGPFLEHLPRIRERGFAFVVQHTINAYPKALEYSVVNATESVEHLRRISAAFGLRAAVWRYDTILMSSLTPIDFHLHNFSRLARDLEGVTDEVVISFAHVYKKTRRNMEWAAREFGFDWHDPTADEKRQLVARLVEIASVHGMTLSICSQRDFLIEGAQDARCVDAQRLEDVGGNAIRATQQGNRKECGCFASRDIGEYDTCPHGCVYCYAVLNRELAQRRFKEHDPESEFLFRAPSMIDDTDAKCASDTALPLFDEGEQGETEVNEQRQVNE